ncbi:imelysin family protein [Sansalvadorimonas sp. 2012CJ34-2]|uniref:Imelysin family protein n=1 Tax=Parendozoicomonas callyspongiae TaxID=2942213 RepID=A0ABT0PGR2_9GAMM|nr:imelysin family protein [Sansalvadorimonas sp. 2012CJ34-2]MCL6269698.1 imelysin family protein [Sansalvadorimonas sp. 2012CJ34-2]
MRFLVFICSITILVACQNVQNPEEKLAQSTTALAQALYGNLSESLGVMLGKTESYCRSSAKASKKDLQEQWKIIMLQWQAASVINFGPITVGSMSWKFQFWPDRRNLVKTKVDEALQEDSELDLTGIGNTNVAARGMGAAEYLLFEYPGLIPNSIQCKYLQVVVADMKRNSVRLSRDWQDGEKRYPVELITFARTQPEGYIDVKPVSSLLINSLYVELEQVYRKLSLPLGEGEKKGNRYMAESWRSKMSLLNLVSSLTSAKNLFLAGDGYGLDDRLEGYGDEGKKLVSSVMESFACIEAGLKRFQKPLSSSVEHTEDRVKVRDLVEEVKQLQRLFGYDIPRLLEIPVSS